MMALTVPLERIESRARASDPRKALLTVLLFVPFAVGWLARKCWMAAVYTYSAIVAGWQDAGRQRDTGGAHE